MSTPPPPGENIALWIVPITLSSSPCNYTTLLQYMFTILKTLEKIEDTKNQPCKFHQIQNQPCKFDQMYTNSIKITYNSIYQCKHNCIENLRLSCYANLPGQIIKHISSKEAMIIRNCRIFMSMHLKYLKLEGQNLYNFFWCVHIG